jgi:hypothetical protein
MKPTRRRKVQLKKEKALPALEQRNTMSLWLRRGWIAVFILVLLFSIGLKIFKADYSGLIYDEVLSFQDYGQSLDDAVGKFDSTNNHVLNSVFIYFGYTLFDSYIHFVRIFSLLAGILFSVSLAYVIYKTIQSDALRVATLAWISLVPFVFDYSYYARGYAYMLAALMTQFALILFLLDHKIRFRHFWIPALTFGLLNFISVGALISSVLLVAAMNLIFVFFFSVHIFRDAPRKWQPIVVTGVSIGFVTSLCTFLLFHKIYDQILDNPVFKEIESGWQGWPSFVKIFHSVFIVQVFQARTLWGDILLWSALGMVAIALLFHLFRLYRALRTGAGRAYLRVGTHGNLILAVTVVVLVILFSYGVITNKSLGLVRNNVYLVPLMILSGSILVDRAIQHISRAPIRQTLCGAVLIVMLSIVARNPASPYYCYSRGASISRPLLRRLQEVDPTRRWVISFHPDRKSWRLPFGYYGYHTKFYTHYFLDFRRLIPYVRGDVEIYPLKKVPPNVTLLDREYFAKANCAVVINQRPLPKPKPIPRRPLNRSKTPPVQK